jgi:hypothetical protein
MMFIWPVHSVVVIEDALPKLSRAMRFVRVILSIVELHWSCLTGVPRYPDKGNQVQGTGGTCEIAAQPPIVGKNQFANNIQFGMR